MEQGIGNKLKILRKKLGLTQESLASKLNLTKQTVINYEGDKNSISVENLLKICKMADMEISTFFSDSFFEILEEEINLYQKIPIISVINLFSERYDEASEWIELPKLLAKDADFAFFNYNEYMSPKIKKGDLILIKKTSNLNTGEIGLFLGDNSALFCAKILIAPYTNEIRLEYLNNPKGIPNSAEAGNISFKILGQVVCSIDYNF